MFSYEERIKAVELYIKYHNNGVAVIRELGYPSRNMLRRWVREYKEEGNLHKKHKRKSKFSAEERKYAINYYLQHGKSINKTIRAIGYPNRYTLSMWLKEDVEGYHSRPIAKSSKEVYTDDDKKEAVIDMVIREQSVNNIANCYGITRTTLYNWKDELLGSERECIMKKQNQNSITINSISNEKEELQLEIERLRKEAYELQLEKDILEKAAQLIKKEEGISLNDLTNKEKVILIDALKEKYSLKELLLELNMAKSSYFYHVKIMKLGDKYYELRNQIKSIYNANYQSYGYRRIHAQLKKEGITVSEKVVRRLMKEEDLIVITIKEKKYSSYKGEISPEVENIVNRDFHSQNILEKIIFLNHYLNKGQYFLN